MISDLANDYSDRFAVVTLHVNADGYDTLWGQKRLDVFYGLTGTVPSFLVDGEWNCPAGDYEYCVQSGVAGTTDVALELGGASVGGATWDVTARICLEGGSDRQMRLYTAATLNDYPNPPTTSRNVLMQDAFEEDVTVPGGGCRTVTTRITFDDQSMASPSDIVVIAWVQAPRATGPTTTYQAAIMRWPFPEGSRLTSIEIAPASVQMDVGDELELTATGRDQNGEIIPLDSPTWSLAGPGSGDGSFDPGSGSPVTTFTATASGTRQIQCQDQGVSGIATLEISESPRLSSLVIAPASVTVNVGDEVRYVVTGFDQLGDPFPVSNPTWGLTGLGTGSGSFDPAVGGETTFTASTPGHRLVMCQDGDITGTASLEIDDPPRLVGLELEPTSVELEVGDQVSFSVVGRDQFGELFELSSPVWTVSGEGGGTLEPASGTTAVFTAEVVGACVVSCAEGGVEGRAAVQIVGDPPRLESIAVRPESAELRVGDSIGLIATGTDQYGEPFALAEPVWRLEGAGDGTLDSTTSPSPTFTATADGEVRLICSDNGIEGAAVLEILPRELPAPRKATRRLRP